MTEFELDRAARFEALENAVTEFLNSDGPFFILAPREEEEDDDDTESDPWDKVASA